MRPDGLLRRHLNGSDGTLAHTLALHVGTESPLFRLLSPSEKAGLLAMLERVVTEALEAQRESLAADFTLDDPSSALSRLPRDSTDANGSMKKEFKTDIDLLLKEMSLDDPNSSMSRLVRQAEKATLTISQQFSLDDDVFIPEPSLAGDSICALLNSVRPKRSFRPMLGRRLLGSLLQRGSVLLLPFMVGTSKKMSVKLSSTLLRIVDTLPMRPAAFLVTCPVAR